ncbi:MAG: hypothetical protein AUH84_05515 [Thaumarchaeota archaeon 13_1_40CM_4_38_7]|nr:MAG: hypothetical protein AUH84_05515 [Thaumarchaeota archaeon 13_1_40CM_4_38_7]
MKNIAQYVIFSAIAAAIVVFCTIGFLALYSNNSEGQLSSANDRHIGMIPFNIVPLEPSSSLGLKQFNSTDELRNFLLVAQARNNMAYPATQANSAVTMAPMMGPVVPTPFGAITSAPTYSQGAVAPSTAESGIDYSATNIQVSNVDEPDFLKNDGKYAYILSQDKLTIVDAYPGDTAKIVSKVGLDVKGQSLQNMFLNKDRLVIFYNGNDEQYSIPKYDYIPNTVYTPTTHAIVIDVSDRENPKILKNYEVNGNYFSARMIGNYVYFISTSNVDYNNPIPPVVRQSSQAIISPPVYYYDMPESNYNFNTVTSFDIFGDKINSQTYLMGSTGTLYVSTDAIYIAYQKNYPYYYGIDSKDRFFNAIVPLLPDDVQNRIKSISQSEMDPDTKWAQISDLMQNTYNNMPESDKTQLFGKIQRALQDYNTKAQEDSTKTVIEKITIDNETLKYVAHGQVPGYLLNQYSMDQSGNKFRVATTSQYYNQANGNGQSNNVYVLDESLNIVGSLEKIAPNEKIYSARFMGDKLYLVTFHRIDPFFVIDLSADTPKVLGALKIPGYSSYLHPYDENHIIGIGKEVTQTQYGNSEPLGVKISLFDVSDVSNPVTVDTYEIGGPTSNSDVLSDPKALLFDKEKNILSLPIWQQQNGQLVPLGEGVTGGPIAANNWQGFYVFGVDPSHGFHLKGTVEHYNGTDYGYSQGSRSFYINESLYTVTPNLMKINDLNNIGHEINQIRLENTGQIIKYLPQ